MNQAVLYNGLTPLFDQVTDSDLPTYFKGAGWVTVEDCDQPGAPLLEALRGPGRIAAASTRSH